MGFKEFVKMLEDTGLFSQGWEKNIKLDKKDPNLDPGMASGGGSIYTGGGAGLGSKQPVRMKKMTKK